MSASSDRIVVAGAGIVGCVQALLLARAGFNVVLVDAGTSSVHSEAGLNIRTVALSCRSRLLLEAQQLWPADLGCEIKAVHVTERGKFGAVRLTADDLDVSALGYVVENSVFENYLISCVLQQPNIELNRPARVQLMSNAESTVSVKIENDKQTIVEKVALLVAADGTHSRIRASLGIKADTTDYQQNAIVANIQCTRSHSNIAYERFTDSGPLALLPLTQKQVAMIYTASSNDTELLLNKSDAEFLAIVQERFGGKLGRFEAIGRRAMFPLMLVQSSAQVSDRTILIGNSANTVHPVAGQGLNLALRDAFELGSLLATVVNEPESLTVTLNKFSKLRSVDQRTVVSQTDLLVRSFQKRPWPLSVPLGMFRTSAMLLLDSVPLLRSKFGSLNAGLHIPVSNFTPMDT